MTGILEHLRTRTAGTIFRARGGPSPKAARIANEPDGGGGPSPKAARIANEPDGGGGPSPKAARIANEPDGGCLTEYFGCEIDKRV